MPNRRVHLFHWNADEAGGLAAGLVDYKVCSIDRTWSGLRYTRRMNTDSRHAAPEPRGEEGTCVSQ